MSRPTTRNQRWATVAGLTATALPGLLCRMRAEFVRTGQLTRPTATAMYSVYAGHALVVAEAARRRTTPLPGPRALPLAGATLLLGGVVLTAASMRRFSGPAQLTGTDADNLVSAGVYRYSRNPQYTGYVLALAGLGLARRSGAVLALAGATAAVYTWWVRVEEAALSRTFGSDYDSYRRRTPRWLGLPAGTR